MTEEILRIVNPKGRDPIMVYPNGVITYKRKKLNDEQAHAILEFLKENKYEIVEPEKLAIAIKYLGRRFTDA